MKLNQIKSNPNNPRFIKDEKFQKLVKSIKEFPKMLELRPLIIDDNYVVLGGNMRLKALQELKYDEIPDTWIKKASDLTEEEKQQFIIKDNLGFGEWDYDELANLFDQEDLIDWGFDEKYLIGDIDEIGELKEDKSMGLTDKFQLILDFENETELKFEYDKLRNEGYKCQVFIL